MRENAAPLRQGVARQVCFKNTHRPLLRIHSGEVEVGQPFTVQATFEWAPDHTGFQPPWPICGSDGKKGI
jgi:hypothetical protein